MRYVAVIPSKNQLNTTILELTPEAYIVPIDNRQAVTALDEMDTTYFANAADMTSASVIPIIESIEWEDDDTPSLEMREAFDLPETATWKEVAYAAIKLSAVTR
jgi:hypothetical protein